MWSYTQDESNWLTVAAVLDSTRQRQLQPPSLAELEMAARRYRARVVAGWIRDGYQSLKRLARSAVYRNRDIAAKPPQNAVGAD